MSKPNLVFIFTDQMRAQATGYAGDPNVQTPYLDKLATQSINFTTAVSTCPICTPYRASLLTGQYPLTHSLFMNDLCLPDNGHAIAHELNRAGYDTAWIGKWHLDGHGRSAYIPPERRQGFQHWQVLECTHEYNNSRYYEGDDDQPRLWPGYDAFAQTNAAQQYLTEHNTDQPFALFLSFGTPHDPYHTAPENLKALYPPNQLALRDNIAPHRRTLASEQLQGYYAHITAIDQCVQQLDETLARLNRQNDTIFVFTSDHGDMLESHWLYDDPERGNRKQCPYDESILVPFLLRYPAKFNAPKTVTVPIATPDIYPTLLSLCDIPIPQCVEGIDFTPTITGDHPTKRAGALIANYHPFADWRSQRGGKPYRGLRTEQYTFVRDLDGPWLLFDNQNDPYQLNNLVNQPAMQNIQKSLDNELDKVLAEQNDSFESPQTLRERYGYEVGKDEAIPYS